MRKIFIVATLALGSFAVQAQEKVMNIVKTDGSIVQTRLADLKQISFLTIEEGGRGLLLKTTDGETVSVLFEANPVVTISSGKLIVKSTLPDAVEIEIGSIEEIQFGEASDVNAIEDIKGFACILQDNGALLRGVPEGAFPKVYSLDGKVMPVPPVRNGEIFLNRNTLGSGIFIVKVGRFSAKIKL